VVAECPAAAVWAACTKQVVVIPNPATFPVDGGEGPASCGSQIIKASKRASRCNHRDAFFCAVLE
jgi:hypothetical protein